MVKYESQCIQCGLPCRHEACSNYRVRVLECDNCGERADKLYIGVFGRELCESCALEEMEVVE